MAFSALNAWSSHQVHVLCNPRLPGVPLRTVVDSHYSDAIAAYVSLTLG